MPSGLLRCGVRGRPYTGQGAKSSQFAYYVCGTLHREGAGACEARYLNAPRVEDFVVERIPVIQSTPRTAVLLGGGLGWGWKRPGSRSLNHSQRVRRSTDAIIGLLYGSLPFDGEARPSSQPLTPFSPVMSLR